MTISMDKKYRTRDGRDIRLLCVDGPEPWPVVYIIDGDSHVTRRTANGNLTDVNPDYPDDLIEYHEPDIRTIWVNVYDNMALPYTTEKSARFHANGTPATIVAQPVTFEVKRT